MDTNRLNWIDWAKAIAITFVVFGHIPEERGSFFLNYIVSFHMPLFFFISGYLTKKEYFNIKKKYKPYLYLLHIDRMIFIISKAIRNHVTPLSGLEHKEFC